MLKVFEINHGNSTSKQFLTNPTTGILKLEIPFEILKLEIALGILKYENSLWDFEI